MIDVSRLNIHVIRDNTGIKKQVPVLFIDGKPFIPLINYMLNRHTSPAINEKLIQAITLLLEYMEANQNIFEKSHKMFEAFVGALYDGTIGKDGIDPSGLYWKPKLASNANSIVHRITSFNEYCLIDSEGVKPINPWREATTTEERMAWAAWSHRKNNSFLSHLMSSRAVKASMSSSRMVATKTPPKVDHLHKARQFPDKDFNKLIYEGFIRPGQAENIVTSKSHNIRDILITLLMNAGGLRVSEPFHLFVSDVIEDPSREGVAFVRLYHPAEGMAPEKSIDENGREVTTNRKQFLLNKYGLSPRNELHSTNTMYAGWKELLLDDDITKSATVQWFPLEAGKTFLDMWKVYLAQRALHENSRLHPYAFVGDKGQPYSIQAFKNNYEAACKRIGVVVSRALGTNAHGHRHSYGHRLSAHGVPPMVIKKAMHHKSVQSQLVYTAPNDELVRLELNKAQKRLTGEELSDRDVSSTLDHIGTAITDPANFSFNFGE
jgi:site-specific recombinase XerD